MSTIRFDPLSLQVEVEGVETAWKLECFPNGKQKIGLNILLHFYDFTWEIRGGHRWCSLRLLVPRQHKRHQQTVQLCYRVGRFTLRRCIGIFYPDRFVNEECSRVMKGKGDHCFRDNQNGWGWLKLVTHQTLRSVLWMFFVRKLTIACQQICQRQVTTEWLLEHTVCYEIQRWDRRGFSL